MKVLIASDLAHTGFGRVGRELATGLLQLGWDIRILGINWRGVAAEWSQLIGGDIRSGMQRATDIMAADPLLDRVLPAGMQGDPMGNNLLAPAAKGQLWPGWVPDRILIVADPRAMFFRLLADQRVSEQIPTYNYVPIEGTNLPPTMRQLYEHARPVAMSRFGQAELEKVLGRPVPLVEHGVSPVFRPLSEADPATYRGQRIVSRAQAKRALGLEDRTVLLRTDRYIERKNYPAFFRVIRPILAANPSAVAIVHTVMQDPDGKGDIRELISREPGAVHDGDYFDWRHPQIHLTGAHDSFRGLADEDLRVLYSAADLYISPTMAEGFGLCLVEAMACGTPVVATDYSAVTEVVGQGGVLIPPASLLTNGYGHEWALVNEQEMSAAIARLLVSHRRRKELGEAAIEHVAQYNWPQAVVAFDRLLEAA